MKAFFTTGLLFLAILLTAPTRVAAQDVERPTPSLSIANGNLSARPLVRYLAARLQLTHEQTHEVQHALRVRPLQVRTPEQISQRLQAVLTPDQYSQLLAIQADADTYKNLRALAVR